MRWPKSTPKNSPSKLTAGASCSGGFRSVLSLSRSTHAYRYPDPILWSERVHHPCLHPEGHYVIDYTGDDDYQS